MHCYLLCIYLYVSYTARLDLLHQINFSLAPPVGVLGAILPPALTWWVGLDVDVLPPVAATIHSVVKLGMNHILASLYQNHFYYGF